MRVLYIHQHFSTPSGTTSIRSYEMALRLIARGHEVIMVSAGLQAALSSPLRIGAVRPDTTQHPAYPPSLR